MLGQSQAGISSAGQELVFDTITILLGFSKN